MQRLRSAGQVGDDERKEITREIVLRWGEEGAIDQLSERYKVRRDVITAWAGSVRGQGIKLPKYNPNQGIFTSSFVSELKELVASRPTL